MCQTNPMQHEYSLRNSLFERLESDLAMAPPGQLSPERGSGNRSGGGTPFQSVPFLRCLLSPVGE